MKKPRKPQSEREGFEKWLALPPDAKQKSMPTALVKKALDSAYNWEECSHRARAQDLDPEMTWWWVKIQRAAGRLITDLTDENDRPFTFHVPASAWRVLHEIDKDLGGTLASPERFLDSDEKRKQYLLRSLREEAIHSSLIEGAVTTRAIADEMLRTKRKPRNEGEQMVLNNYRTIRMLNERKSEALTPSLLMEIQSSLTQETSIDPDAVGRFRRPDEAITVWDMEEHEPLFTPPPAQHLPKRIEALCRFANEPSNDIDGGEFLHPALRAIILHFWLAYEHPFVDGNGRTARALFYWSMLRSGYWLTEYLTISTVISGQPKQYAKAFLDTEIDDNDLTYFIVYHLRVIDRSLKDFRAYVERKAAEQRETASLLGQGFNARQRALLNHSLKDATAIFTYESHANSQGVSIPTAREDLLDLERRKLLKGNRRGRAFEFSPVPDLESRLKKLSKSN